MFETVTRTTGNKARDKKIDVIAPVPVMTLRVIIRVTRV